MRSLLFLFAVMLWGALNPAMTLGESLRLARHSVVYLPDTDEVRFRAQFDREPAIPPDQFTFFVYPGDDYGGAVSGIWSHSINDGTIAVERINGPFIGPELGRQPFELSDMLFEVTFPFDILRVERYDFLYGVSASTTGQEADTRLGQAQYAIAEPTTLGLTGACFMLGIYMWRRAKRRSELVALKGA
jgi:hypothetical protein